MVEFRIWQIAGWTMLHYLWAGGVLGVIAVVLRRAMRGAGANPRYLAALSCFAVLGIAPLPIAVVVSNSLPPVPRSEPVLDRMPMPPTLPPEEMPTEPAVTLPTFASTPAPVPSPQPSKLLQSMLNRAALSLPWLWVFGAPMTFLLTTLGLLGAERLRRQSRLLEDAPITETCRRLAAALRISQRVGVGICDRIAAPILVGIFRPLILLPAAALAGWEPQQLEMVLLHELAHVRRFDNLVNLIQRIVESVLFFHPMVWVVSAWVQQEREHCCDELVVARTQQPRAYAEILIHFADKVPSSPFALASTASSMAERSLVARIRCILKKEEQTMQVSRKTVGLMFVGLLAVVMIIGGYCSLPSHAEDAAGKVEAQSKSEAATPKTTATKPVDEVSPASDQSATKEGIGKAGSVTWKTTFYKHITSKDGKKTWLKTETQLNAYKAPGLYRITSLDEKGQVAWVEITDVAHKKRLSILPGTKEATLSEIVGNLPDPHGPFDWVKEKLEDTDGHLQWVETRKTASGDVNIFRYAKRDQWNGRDWSDDIWIDKKSKQLIEIHCPGADIYDPDTDPARNTTPETAWSTILPAHFEHDIVFDADLDDSLFRLEPPDGYTVKIQPRGQVTENEMIDYLGILADFNGKTFPDETDIPNDRVNKAWNKPKKDRTAAEQKLIERKDYYIGTFQRMPVGLFVEDHTVEKSFRYLGKGVKLGDKGRIVCWYKLKGAKNPSLYRAVYGDLSVKDVAPEDLPLRVENGKTSAAKPAAEVSPASDQSATKEGAKTESKPANGGNPSKIQGTFEGRSLEDWKRLSLHDLSWQTRAKAMGAMGVFGHAGRREEAITAIKAALDQTEDYNLSKAGYETLVGFGPVALPLLLDGLKSKKTLIRRTVTEVLGNSLYAMNPSEADQIVSALVRATEDEDVSVQATACHSLGSRNLASSTEAKRLADRIVPALIKLLGKKQVVECIFDRVVVHSSARHEACVALEQYGAKAEPAVPALLAIAQEEAEPSKWNPSDQELAIHALGEIGPSAKSAIVVLERLRDDKKFHFGNHTMQRIPMVADNALKKIQGTSDTAPASNR